MYKKILLIYIEPTPYILSLIETLSSISVNELDIFFLRENKSQNWNIVLDKKYKVLAKNPITLFGLIKKILFQSEYNLIHIAGWSEPLALLFILFTKLAGKFLTIETDTPIPNKISLWKKSIKRLFYPRLFSFIDIFLAGGSRQIKYLEYYGVKTKKIFPIKMTVDINAIKQRKAFSSLDKNFIRKKYRIDENKIVFLFVGRLVPHKGINDLLKVFERLSHLNVILLIAGDGPLRIKVEKASQINDKICYAGRLSGNDLIDLYHAADVLVLPSHAEPWGLVVNEGMAAGLPVIVSDRVGCIDDLVIHKKTGLIIKAECLDDLQKSIEYMTNAEHERNTMAAYSKILIEDWTLENEAKNICAAWNKLICI